MKKEPLKVVAMSDIHGLLPRLDDMPPGDVLCITGDIMPLDVQSDTVESIAWLCSSFYNWVNSLPYEKVIFIAGNHDFLFETLMTDRNGQHRKANRVCKKLKMPEKLIYLENSEYMYKGYRFYGSPWCPDLTRWAFYKDGASLQKEFDKIPDNTDVLLTHCPPQVETFGMVQQSGFNYLMDYGCDELRAATYAKKPRLSIFGHVHSGRHSRLEIDGTMYANVSIKDENYEYTYSPQIFTLTPDSVQ